MKEFKICTTSSAGNSTVVEENCVGVWLYDWYGDIEKALQ